MATETKVKLTPKQWEALEKMEAGEKICRRWKGRFQNLRQVCFFSGTGGAVRVPAMKALSGQHLIWAVSVPAGHDYHITDTGRAALAARKASIEKKG
ncbi:MAG TPA: hypothetical protein VHQ47_08745 [Phycisphaerae bacterium]|nr:hypothetical protein [Phycisphaerae bacterium]